MIRSNFIKRCTFNALSSEDKHYHQHNSLNTPPPCPNIRIPNPKTTHAFCVPNISWFKISHPERKHCHTCLGFSLLLRHGASAHAFVKQDQRPLLAASALITPYDLLNFLLLLLQHHIDAFRFYSRPATIAGSLGRLYTIRLVRSSFYCYTNMKARV
jgi:hypothetical protein